MATVKPKPKAKPKAKKTNPNHELFIREYVANFGNGVRAYQKVYPKVNYDSARAMSSKLLANINIRAKVEAEYKKYFAEKDSEIEKSKTYQLIHAVGVTDISEVLDLENGNLTVKDISEISPNALHAIKSIERTERSTQMGTDVNVKVTMHDKLAALALRAKIQKLIDTKEDAQQLEIIIIPARRPVRKNAD